MPPWSSLQRQIHALLEPTIDLRIHCSAYRMQSQRGSANLPRYWITLGKKIIWDYPRQFVQLPSHPQRGKRPVKDVVAGRSFVVGAAGQAAGATGATETLPLLDGCPQDQQPDPRVHRHARSPASSQAVRW
jgi:hypothetical protein